MPEDLIIVGAGGFSASIALAVETINQTAPRWNLLGFLDDDPARHGAALAGYPILGPIASAAQHPNARFVLGLANHRRRTARRTVAEAMAVPLDRFATIVHPAASVCRTAALGTGTVILQNTVVNHGVSVGNHVLLSESCSLGHDSKIADYVTLAAGVITAGSVKLSEGAYLGAGSRILEFREIGEYALVGIGAVVLKSVPPRTTVFGNPARAIPGGEI